MQDIIEFMFIKRNMWSLSFTVYFQVMANQFPEFELRNGLFVNSWNYSDWS